ncbi:hypothetical protein LZU96_21355 (plasmid) [Pantoea agglomerans]|uniref:hypothetical protein n=1 Tax=Enterobacter agglomerans TaxID=549 RepID=UPI001F200398|nr:hypothetical protein [Pantoea agglomerans]UIL54696.1 hypothetical protein LZU96_21355 [Pantoea agglomerans]
MNITEHEMRGLITGKAMPADIFVGESLAAYLVRKFAVQQKARDALAAESAARGEIIERLIGQYSAAGYHAVQDSLNPAQSWLYDAMQVLKQTATDTYLNSVRADGVEAFAHQQRVIADATPAAAFQRDRRFAAGLAEDFAAQLRAGKDGE